MSDWSQYTRDAQMQYTGSPVGAGTGAPYSPNSDQYGSQAGYQPSLDPSQILAQQQQWGFDQGLSSGMTQAGPQFALNQNTRESLAGQIAAQSASYGQQSGFLNQDYQNQLARLGLQGQQLGVQQSGLARQPAYLSALHDLTNQSLQSQAGIATRAQMSSATARGAFNTPGNVQHLDDISSQLANQLSRSDTQYNEQVSSLGDQNKMLDLQSQSLGLSRDALKTELDRGLDRLGLSNQMSLADLTQKMNSSSIQDQMLAQQIFNAALASSDYYAQFAPLPSQAAPGNVPPITQTYGAPTSTPTPTPTPTSPSRYGIQ